LENTFKTHLSFGRTRGRSNYNRGRGRFTPRGGREIHNLKAKDRHQAHMLILHQQEEGGATILIVIIKLKGMINLTSNAIIAINLGILHQNVGENNMT
jgi:hypothetical protein